MVAKIKLCAVLLLVATNHKIFPKAGEVHLAGTNANKKVCGKTSDEVYSCCCNKSIVLWFDNWSCQNYYQGRSTILRW